MSHEDIETPEQLRDEMLAVFQTIATYWATLPDHDPATGREYTAWDRCDGVVFSILSQLDGCGALPAFDLVATCGRKRLRISDTLHERYCALNK